MTISMLFGSVEDESLIKRMNKKDSSKKKRNPKGARNLKKSQAEDKGEENPINDKAGYKKKMKSTPDETTVEVAHLSGEHTLMTEEEISTFTCLIDEEEYPLKKEILIFFDYRVTLGFGSTGGLDLACPIIRLSSQYGIQWVLGRITNSLPGPIPEASRSRSLLDAPLLSSLDQLQSFVNHYALLDQMNSHGLPVWHPCGLLERAFSESTSSAKSKITCASLPANVAFP
ncbi:hypothetical protein Tco_1108283 [Tanacetum coccineum]